jgi:hypothetical protein
VYLLGLVVATIAAGVVALIVFRSFRRADDREWRTDWRRLPRSKRREISRAVRQGHAVRDPRDAPRALDLVAQLERQAARYQSRRGQRFELAVLVVEVALIAGALVAALRRLDVGAVMSLLLPVLLLAAAAVGFRRMSRRQASRRAEARRANEELLMVLAPPTERQSPRGGGYALERT